MSGLSYVDQLLAVKHAEHDVMACQVRQAIDSPQAGLLTSRLAVLSLETRQISSLHTTSASRKQGSSDA